jgi:hypothetical protein
MRSAGVSGLGWQEAAYLLADLGRYLAWTLMGGCVACGAWWCTDRVVYQEWVRERSAPHIRSRAERRLCREAARGVTALEEYLRTQASAGGRSPSGADEDATGRSGHRDSSRE